MAWSLQMNPDAKAPLGRNKFVHHVLLRQIFADRGLAHAPPTGFQGRLISSQSTQPPGSHWRRGLLTINLVLLPNRTSMLFLISLVLLLKQYMPNVEAMKVLDFDENMAIETVDFGTLPSPWS